MDGRLLICQGSLCVGLFFDLNLENKVGRQAASLTPPPSPSPPSLIGLFASLPFPSKVRSFGLADGGQLFLPQPLSLSLLWPLGVRVRSGGL